MDKTLEFYLHLPYTRELVPAPGGAWFARIKELPGCTGQGATAEDALRSIEQALVGWLTEKLEAGEAIPEADWEDIALFSKGAPGAAVSDLDQAGWLVNTGRPLEAARWIEQALSQGLLDEDQRQAWLHRLSQAALDSYTHGNGAAARELLDRLVHLLPCPEQPGQAERLVELGQWDQAEDCLLRSLEDHPAGRKGGLYNQLAFIHLVQGRYDQANRDLSAALMEDDEQAALRVVFWIDGALIQDAGPDPAHPRTTHLAAFACQAALSLAQKNLPRAEMVLKTMQVYEQEVPLTLQVWGCVAWAQGNRAKAREVWNHALRLVKNPREQRMMLDWLDAGPPMGGSFARDITRRHGISYDQLAGQHDNEETA